MPEPPPSTFEIRESCQDGWLQLKLSGELDRVSTRRLEDRLANLRATRSPVGLDLSHLDFIDSTGIHLLTQTVGDARIKGWQVQIEPNVSPQVMRLLKLVHLDRIILATNGQSSRQASED